MEEKVLKGKKLGMPVLVLTTLILVAAIPVLIFGCLNLEGEGGNLTLGAICTAIGGVVLCFGWIPYMGLRILKPQEALVLTLFGKYIGTLKGEGFYAVNPFCGSVNPAAKTKLN
jgi:hypothetical protein